MNLTKEEPATDIDASTLSKYHEIDISGINAGTP